MQTLTVRRLQPTDMDRWFEMRIESLHDSPSAFLASPESELLQGVEVFRRRIENGGNENLIIGCFDADNIVGSVGLFRESSLKTRHKGIIWGMYVKPSYRNREIGRKLLQSAIETAKVVMRAKKVDLSVDASREPAKRLYASLGFKKWGHEQFAIQIDGKFYDEEYMSLIFEQNGES